MDYTYLVNKELEESILGAMIMNKDSAIVGLQSLELEDFYIQHKEHRYIFEAMKDLNDDDKDIDVTSLIAQLQQNKTYELIGGVDFLNSLVDKVYILENFEQYIAQLKDFTLLRKLAIECENIVKESTSKEVSSITDFLTKCENNIIDITNRRRVSNFQSAGTIASIIGDQIRKSSGDDKVTGLSTGFSVLDKKINGFGNGQMIVLAARPGVGKSALALNMAYNIAQKQRKTIAYFSLEMSNEELMRRLFALASGISQNKITTGFLNQTEKQLLLEYQREISDTNMYFEESPSVTIDDIVIKCQKLKEQRNDLALIIVDHIGIIQEGSKKFKSDQEKISFFARRLKTLSLDLNIPILVVCHINREVDKNKGKSRIPELSELRGSGEIENSADKVLLMYRESYYKSQGVDVASKKGFGDELSDDNNPFPKSDNDDSRGQKVDILIAKNRQGPTGKVPLLFFLATGRFAVPTEEVGAALDQLDH